jgi:hypothetical protein
MIICGTFDGELAFGKRDDGNGKTGVADIDKSDVAGVVGFRKISFCDAIAKGGGSCVVYDAEDVETGDGSRV